MDIRETNQPAQQESIGRRVRAPKRRGKGLRRILLLLAAFLIGLLAYDLIAVMKFLDRANHNHFTPIGNTVSTDKWEGKERVNVLLLGVDNRDKDTAPRSDTMMLVSIDPATGHADLLSIMRDTYVTVPGHGKSKINAAFAIGGPELAVKTVENFLQIPIHYYVVTDFKGFEGVIDAIGGVDMNVEIPMKYVDDGVYDINLKPGQQHLNGREALQYVRYRGDARADFARTERQRKLVKAVLAEMKTPLTLVRFPAMLKQAEPYVQTNMTVSDLTRLSTDLLAIDSASMKSYQIPPDDLLTETYNNLGESILEPDVKAVQKFVREALGNSGGSSVHAGSGLSTNASAAGGDAANSGGSMGTNAAAGSGTGGKKTGQRTATVTDPVNVRQGPGTNHAVIASASPGEEVTVLGEEGGWYNVKLRNGTVGYIFGQYLTLNQ
ncbi:LCP family protein [Effusibacillus pohliae]|uniref:LCP family protein n=1 Tax=Effusibacillus pohliae TaxID=232270 RepID=UPI00037EE9D1|nr:LCP family protein [Effusibacillus pohliae]